MNDLGRIFLLCWVLILLGSGCENAVEPENKSGSSSGFAFSPESDQVAIALGELFIFQITHVSDPVFDVAWQLNGREVGIGPRYGLIPSAIGQDTLVALVSWQDLTEQRIWFVESVFDTIATITFKPTQRTFELTVGDTVRFDINSTRPDLTSYRWELGQQVMSEASSYLHTAAVPGQHMLRGTAITPTSDQSNTWAVHTYAPGQLPPLPPEESTAVLGEEIASLAVSWRPPEPRGDAIVAYAVAINYAGPLDQQNWDEAVILAEVPATPATERFSVVISAANSDIVPGERGWLAIASVNSYGVICAQPPNHEVGVTEPWWITGTVTDEAGAPLVDVIVHDPDLEPTTRTDSAGSYLIGPFASITEVTLRTEVPAAGESNPAQGIWYDVIAETLVFGGPAHWGFTLIGRAGLTSDCSVYGGDFLAYLRSMTRTTQPTNRRPNLKVFKWESYPVPVWVPASADSGSQGSSFLFKEAVSWWNEAMGTEYLTLVEDRSEARIVVRFGDDDPAIIGKVDLLLPNDANYVMGEVIPELVEVYVLEGMPSQRFQEVSLHELGHALGLSGHALCADGDYLMYVSSAGILDDGPQNAIHFDEKRALGAVRNFSQGYDMGLVDDGTE